MQMKGTIDLAKDTIKECERLSKIATSQEQRKIFDDLAEKTKKDLKYLTERYGILGNKINY